MRNKFNRQYLFHQFSIKPGFTLMEVAMAMAVFAIGMAAVAAIFPVAIHLQRSVVQDVNAKQFETSAQAMIKTLGFDENKISSAAHSGHITMPMSSGDYNVVLRGPDTMKNQWSLEDRSYAGADHLTLHNRHLFWVPLFYKQDSASDWQVYLFIVSNSNNANYTLPSGVTAVANVAWGDGGGRLSPSDNPEARPAIPRVAKIAVTPVIEPRGIFLQFNNNFNNHPGGPNSDKPLRIKPGNYVITFSASTNPTKANVNRVRVIAAADDGSSITVAGSIVNVNYIWAVLPGTRNGEIASAAYLDIIGPLTGDYLVH